MRKYRLLSARMCYQHMIIFDDVTLWHLLNDIMVNLCSFLVSRIKLMNGKALRKHSLHDKTAALVLLKPFISCNE